nr:hypothetical protein [Tanacetum cinerariifolium]
MKANDDKINNLEIEFDHFQKQCEQMQDDLLNQMRNFMQNFHDGHPGEDKETEATTDTELPSTEDIQPLPVQEPPQDSDIRQLIREECCAEVPEQQKQKMEDTMLELVKIYQEKEFLSSLSDPEIVSIEEENVVQQKEEEERLIKLVKNDISDNSSNDPLLEEVDLFLSNNSIPPGIADDPEGDIRFLEELLIDNSILSHESFDSNFKDNPSIP